AAKMQSLDITKLLAAQVGALSTTAAGNLSGTQITSLAAVTTEVQALSAAALNALSAANFATVVSHLSANQVASLGTTQLKNLSNAGVAGLVCALVVGPRIGLGRENMAPFNLVYTLIGASLLWVGWFGFNAGSALGANALAGSAMAATQIAAAAAALSWTAAEWAVSKTPTLLGMCSGAVAGLVAITPASGFVLPSGALAIGLIAGGVCYLSAVWLKRIFRYDDSLDAFGVHGVGGLVGALLTGVFASRLIQATDGVKAFEADRLRAVGVQALGCLATVAWSAIGTFAILMLCKATTGLRVAPDAEREGLDMALHGEALHEH
ncbi:MAG: ammonium transporter, partial [Caulobacteraceae bacterium]|nr:ammonium transporter [Caulobacter sp.]